MKLKFDSAALAAVGVGLFVLGGLQPAWAETSQQTFDAAKALGQSQAQQSMTGLQNGSSQSTVQSTVPGYTSNPPQTQYYTNKNLSGGTADLQAQCQSNPSDPTCSGIKVGTQQRPATTVTQGSPALASQAAVENPTTVLGDVAHTYNACATGGAMQTPAVWEQRTCSLETSSWSDAACTKTLDVDPLDSYSCEAGSTLAYVQINATMSVQAVCDPVSGNQVPFTFYAWGSHGACNGPQTVRLDLSRPQPQSSAAPPIVAEVIPDWHGRCFPMEVSWTGQGCQDLQCSLTVHFVQSPGVVTNYACPEGEVTADQIAFDDNAGAPRDQCYVGYASPEVAPPSAPPGFWGTSQEYYLYWVPWEAATMNGWSWAAGEHYTADVSFAQPYFKPASGDTWTNTCKPYEDRSPVLPADGQTPSAPPVLPLAMDIGQDQCVRKSSVCTDGPSTRIIDGIEVTRQCWAYSNVFSCTALQAPSTCADPSFRACSADGAAQCVRDDGWGHCVSTQQTYDCKVAEATFSPALNCGNATFCANGSCWDTTTADNDQFSYTVAQMEAHVEAGKDFDEDTLQIFKGTDSRCHQSNFGIDNCCQDSSYLERCTQSEQDTVHNRDAGKCHAVGEYCSASVLSVCREETHTYCCFSSLLARLVQEQGRLQIGRDWGTPEAPNCVGFSPDELARLDWSRFDLSEFYAQIRAQQLDQGQVTNSASGQQSACYYGQGKC